MKPTMTNDRHLPLLLVYACIVVAAGLVPDWSSGYAAPAVCLLLAALALVAPPGADLRPAASLAAKITVVAAVLLGIAGLHVARLPLAVSDSIWLQTGELIDLAAGSIGVDRGTPLTAMGGIAATALSFLLAVRLTRDDDSLLLLWLGLVFASAALLLIQAGLAVVTLVLEGASGGLGSVVIGPAADRQAASARFGLLTLTAFALFRYRYSRYRTGRDTMRYPLQEQAQPAVRIVLATLAAATLMFLAALGVTGSLEGQFATTAGLLTISVIYALKRAGTNQRMTGSWTTRAIALFAFMIGLLALIVSGTGAADLCRWTASVQAATASPVIGNGFGTASAVMELFVTSDCLAYRDAATPYNGYLALIASGGLISLAMVAYCAAVLVRTYVGGAGGRQRMRVFPITGLGIVLLLAVHTALADPLAVPGVAILAGAMLGSAAAVSFRRKRTADPRSASEDMARSGDFSGERAFTFSRGFQSE